MTAISKSAKYYRSPQGAEARKKKQAYDKKLNSRPSQIKHRVELNKYNRHHGTKGDGLDASHKGGKIVGLVKASSNRGSKVNSRGDRNARGKGK